MSDRTAPRPGPAPTAVRRDDVAPGALLYPLEELAATAGVELDTLPYTVRLLLENAAHVVASGKAGPEALDAVLLPAGGADVAFQPARVVLQDFSGVPVALDLAALRAAAVRRGLPAAAVVPAVPADLVVDHSVRVDAAGTSDALRINTGLEFSRNRERYALLRWAEQAFDGFRVVPPGNGIVHQVNLERLAQVVVRTEGPEGAGLVRPDTVLGTDSHTPMIGALGVLGWGIGGIEAVSVLLGEPVLLAPPRVVGVRLTGALPAGTTATDLVLTLTERLRRHGVVGAFVEFFGEGCAELGVPDRATLANMAPDYGATTALFPVDAETLAFLRTTGRPQEHVGLVERYCRAQGLYRGPGSDARVRYPEVLTVDLGEVEACVAGPGRPDQRVPLRDVPRSLPAAPAPGGRGDRPADGSVFIAAITSCTNTSHPGSMLTAGLVARRAVEFGLTVPSWVKTSLAPGSRTVPAYLRRAGVLPALEELGFHTVAFGCTTCHGMSGDLLPGAARAVAEEDVLGAAVLSGNRNFEGRIHPQVKAAYLASPGLVVVYALAGTVARDLTTEPVAVTPGGRKVFLRDLWPTAQEVAEAVRTAVGADLYDTAYAGLYEGGAAWRALDAPRGDLYEWPGGSDYILEPPYLDEPADGPAAAGEVTGGRILALLGDSVSTDHISPVGAIPRDGDAGRYLSGLGVPEREFNSFGARRGNHHVMVRGTFGNVRLRNALADGREGPWTRLQPTGEVVSIHEAAQSYRAAGVPLVVVAGAEYGCGSARDWAAKGTALLGVRAVLAKSFERIHRSNLVCMGVLPLVFPAGLDAGALGLDGTEEIDLLGLAGLGPRGAVTVRIRRGDGSERSFEAVAALETLRECAYFTAGGVLPYTVARLEAARHPMDGPG
ncbi:aconitate hydratase AcnA [Streptomyces bambusae]|uniref:aconitate hydratase AcnA n=1 Tax=Streptomyces bambusae TaxID=1550616 RepID=UPI001CFC6523|nr:aconitate hydratase AcnA [Streptomyces bambusae]MCB5167434.1 aconitate hydratase AcnA [Streptomyces bambusae]